MQLKITTSLHADSLLRIIMVLGNALLSADPGVRFLPAGGNGSTGRLGWP
jgi:hypothetical protein